MTLPKGEPRAPITLSPYDLETLVLTYWPRATARLAAEAIAAGHPHLVTTQVVSDAAQQQLLLVLAEDLGGSMLRKRLEEQLLPEETLEEA